MVATHAPSLTAAIEAPFPRCAITSRLEQQLAQFSQRALEVEYPYVIVDARYERVREGGVIVNRAILVALGIDWEGQRQVLAVE